MNSFRQILFVVFLVLISQASVFAELQGISEQIMSIDTDSDNLYLATYNQFVGSWVKVYDLQKLELISKIEVGQEIIPQIKVIDKTAYAASHDGTMNVYSAEPELSLIEKFNASDRASILWEDIDDNFLFTYDALGSLKVWDRTNFSLVHEFDSIKKEDTEGFVRFLFYSDKNRLYGVSSEGVLEVWNITDWSLIKSVEAGVGIGNQDGDKYIEAFYVGDDFIYTAFNDGRWTEVTLVEVWDKQELTQKARFTTDKILTSLVSDSENLYAVSRTTSEIFVYDKSNFSLKKTFVYESLEELSALAVRNDKLFVSSFNGTVRIFNVPGFVQASVIGEPLPMKLSRTSSKKTINAIPMMLFLLIISVLFLVLPEKHLEKIRKISGNLSLKDIMDMVLISGAILLLVSFVSPTLVSKSFTTGASISQYFDIFIRKGTLGYYWFIFWSMLGYWFMKDKGRKVAAISSAIFLALAYAAFSLLP